MIGALITMVWMISLYYAFKQGAKMGAQGLIEHLIEEDKKNPDLFNCDS